MNKHDVAAIFYDIARLLELKGESSFKSRAYEKAASVIETLDVDLGELVKLNKVGELPSIGPKIAARVEELVTTGRLAYHEELRGNVPFGLLEMLTLPGLGPKTIRKFYQELEIDTIEKLEQAVLTQKLRSLSGMAAKTEAKIKNAIALFKKNKDKFRYNIAIDEAEKLVCYLGKSSLFESVTIVGDLRRYLEIVRNIELIAVSTDNSAALSYLFAYADLDSVLTQSDYQANILLLRGIEVEFQIVAPHDYPFALQHFTGSASHIKALQKEALNKNLRLNGSGLFQTDNTLIACHSEDDIYRHLGLAYIPPALREDRGELEAAKLNKIPKLIRPEDLQGILHVHTTASDGRASLTEMAHQSIKYGFSYLGITEHSQSAGYAHGLSVTRLEESWAEIDAFNEKQDELHIFKGIESDIRKDGRLDYPDDVLKKFDFVITSIHSSFSMSEPEMTRRIIRALEHEATTILGHPTGRLLLIREPYRVDIKKVIEAAAANGKAIELNCNPMRLDLDWRNIIYARELGVKIALCPDAHTPAGLGDIFLGRLIAMKGWLEADDVLNTMALAEITAYFNGDVK